MWGSLRARARELIFTELLLPHCCQTPRSDIRGFRFSIYLQEINEWRDPDSNRGHHDFQARALGYALASAGSR